MALPVLDGNQTATTLSSVVTGGEHIVAHTVVSLGSTAISNITSAVSGSVVSISNFPSTQTIAGTVTANDSGALTIVNSSTVTKADVKFTALAGAYNPTDVASTYTLKPLPTSFSGKLLIDASSDSGGGSVVGYDGSAFIRVAQSPQSVVTVGSLPAISGTVTVGNNNFNIKTVVAQDGSSAFTATNGTQFRLYTPTGASKTLNNIFGPTPSWVEAFADSITWFSDSGTQVEYFHDGTQWTLNDVTTPAGTLALDGSVFVTNISLESFINLLNGFTASQVGSAFVNGSGALRVNLYSSTVTAAAPNGSLTTRFGTPTTANVSFATAAVTKNDRKYLLIQNVTTGSNVITVGIGFTPTTTQGIQLTAGAGIIFESSYIPTGAVRILSSVTASNYTILEA